MKTLAALTFVITAIGLFISISIVRDYYPDCVKLISIPYAVLFALLLFVNIGHRSNASKVSLFISACLISLICTSAYYGASHSTSRSSTEGLTFSVLPIFALGLIPFVDIVIRLLLAVFKFVKGL